MISVVTPSFRQLDWLRLCVASVADQQGVEVEQLVQDAGSENVSLSYIRPQSPGPDYRLELQIEPDRGMYDAINRGLQRARGEICAYLNCDEQYLPGTLARVSEFFRTHPGTNVLFGDVILVDDEGTPLSYRRVVLPSASHLRLVHLNTASCATFFRRELLERGFYFDPQWKAIGDTAWVYALLQAGAQMQTLPEPLATFTFTGENLGATALSTTESRSFARASGFDFVRRPAAILSHRLQKFWAGAYVRRRVEIEIYTRDSPHQRERRVSPSVGFGWPSG